MSPWASLVAQLVKNLPAMQETWVLSLGWKKSPGEESGNPLQYSCLENPPGQRSLVGYTPWGCKESDITEWLSTSQFRPEIYLFLYYSNFLDIYVDNFMLHLLIYVDHFSSYWVLEEKDCVSLNESDFFFLLSVYPSKLSIWLLREVYLICSFLFVFVSFLVT